MERQNGTIMASPSPRVDLVDLSKIDREQVYNIVALREIVLASANRKWFRCTMPVWSPSKEIMRVRRKIYVAF